MKLLRQLILRVKYSWGFFLIVASARTGEAARSDAKLGSPRRGLSGVGLGPVRASAGYSSLQKAASHPKVRQDPNSRHSLYPTALCIERLLPMPVQGVARTP